MIELQNNPNLHLFSTDAMNTTFSLHMDHADRPCAEDAASACFVALEELESQLSRYRHDSDICRINALQAGQSLLIAESTHACLLQAFEAGRQTAGLFDVTLGTRTQAEPLDSDVTGQLEVDPDHPRVTCCAVGRQIDLGGIGKGFALDHLAQICSSYGIHSALLTAGASTLLALGSEIWPVLLQGDEAEVKIELIGQALSASGTSIQGAHVIHPDHGRPPEYVFKRVWLTLESAAQADAFSTACLLMDDQDIQSFAAARGHSMAVYTEPASGGSIRKITS